MPLPMSLQPIDNLSSVASAVEAALVKSEIIPANETAKEILNSCGASLEQAVVSLSNLMLTAKDNVKHAAIRDILDLHGVQFKKDTAADLKPNIVFHVHSENTQMNMDSLFAPKR